MPCGSASSDSCAQRSAARVSHSAPGRRSTRPSEASGALPGGSGAASEVLDIGDADALPPCQAGGGVFTAKVLRLAPHQARIDALKGVDVDDGVQPALDAA